MQDWQYWVHLTDASSWKNHHQFELITAKGLLSFGEKTFPFPKPLLILAVFPLKIGWIGILITQKAGEKVVSRRVLSRRNSQYFMLLLSTLHEHTFSPALHTAKIPVYAFISINWCYCNSSHKGLYHLCCSACTNEIQLWTSTFLEHKQLQSSAPIFGYFPLIHLAIASQAHYRSYLPNNRNSLILPNNAASFPCPWAPDRLGYCFHHFSQASIFQCWPAAFTIIWLDYDRQRRQNKLSVFFKQAKRKLKSAQQQYTPLD